MTDRELLEKAAKACGFPSAKHHSFVGMEIRYGYKEALWIESISEYWNPLESDADTFRLMVDCDISLTFDKEYVDADGWLTIYFIDYNNDKHAAIRRAIVRAAAGE